MNIPLLEAWQDWECPACHLAERTRPLPPNASRFHTCPALHDLTAPLVRAGTDCKLVAVQWEDYQGKTMTQDGDDRRPYSSVDTVRADGTNDVAVLAPCATATFG